MALLVLAWGNIVSVRHPSAPDVEPTFVDGLVGMAAALLPCAATIGILRSGSLVGVQMAGMVATCAFLYYASLRFAGPYFSRNFDRVRALLVG